MDFRFFPMSSPSYSRCQVAHGGGESESLVGSILSFLIKAIISEKL